MLSKLNKLKFWNNKNISMSLKLTLIYAAVFSLAILIISVVTFSFSRYLGEKRIKGYMRDISQQLENYIKKGKPIDEEIFTEINFNGPLNFKLYNQQGKILLRSRPHLFNLNFKANLNKITTLETSQLKSKRSDNKKRISLKDNLENRSDERKIKVLYLNQKVKYQGRVFYIQIINLQHIRDDFLNILLGILIVINILAVLFSIIIGSYIAKKVLQPIQEINQTAQKITINDLDDRINTDRPNDELKELATTFNEMIDRLQNSIEKQKQFVADASHELRTPISVMQGYIDLLDRWGTEDEEVLKESIEAIQSETINIKKMLEQLLFLARGDREQYKFNKEEFELKRLVAEVYEEMKLVDSTHDLKLSRNEAARIMADSKLIKQLLRIILDNSIKYTPKQGQIIINSTRINGYAEISIKDTGCGIPKKVLDKVFDRFYRVDESRNRDTGGAGLGLSIAKWIVKEHDGEISVESKVGQGTTIIIKLLLA